MNIETALPIACRELSIPRPEIISRQGLRITLNEPTPEFYKHVLKLEARMQKMTGKLIELMFEPLVDKNKRAGRNGRE